ncbi:MAG: Verru_Chthon cassette protein D [Verrucomicrobiae bacterium]|nr:Verru_Chthon cassette protein D [Verrucomicrobiae bacterium]
MKRIPNSTPAMTKQQRGFSMIELLVVMGVIAIILAMAVPAMQSMLAGNKLVQAADDLQSALATMQQEAIKGNEAVEVRFYTFRDLNLPISNPQFRAYQFVKKVTATTERDRKSSGRNDGFVVIPLSKIERLPEGVIMLNESEYSTLITSQKMIRETRNVRIPDSEDGEYYAFHFRPDGSTTLPKTGSEQWYVTLVNEADVLANAGGLPANFVTLQVDAHNGTVRKFQPGVQ